MAGQVLVVQGPEEAAQAHLPQGRGGPPEQAAQIGSRLRRSRLRAFEGGRRFRQALGGRDRQVQRLLCRQGGGVRHSIEGDFLFYFLFYLLLLGG